MVPSLALAAYKDNFEQRVLSASPVELISIVFDETLGAIRLSRVLPQPGRTEQLGKALRLVRFGLVPAINDDAGEISANLRVVYAAAAERLVRAMTTPPGGEDPSVEAENLISQISDGWKAAFPREQ